MKKEAVVLLSGGQDSTTVLFMAKERYGAENVLALSLYYGQRHNRELAAARTIARLAGVDHEELALPVFDPALALLDPGAALTSSGGAVDVEAPAGLPSSFVPGRNLVFLAVAASRAASLHAGAVWTGVCETDYSGYPDCRAAFLTAMEAAVRLALPSTTPVRLVAPLMRMSKADTVRAARTLPGAWEALAKSVTCYRGERPGCGECPSCQLRAAGFSEAGFTDPAKE